MTLRPERYPALFRGFAVYHCIVLGMDPLNELRLVAAAIRERDALIERRGELIVAAYEARVPWADICLATGLTRQAAYNAYQRAIKRRTRE